MRTAQAADRVQVHYRILSQDGSVTSSRERGPLELTVGIDHPKLPGLGLALVGLAPGQSMKLDVPAERAYGPTDPGRIRRLARTRFADRPQLPIGKWIRILDRRGRRRLVRILEVSERQVVVDTNHPHAGQALQFEVQLVAIHTHDTGPGLRETDRAGRDT
jgi:FKBP-type peptidyl-prolyl cis-trans isomerase SlyD